MLHPPTRFFLFHLFHPFTLPGSHTNSRDFSIQLSLSQHSSLLSFRLALLSFPVCPEPLWYYGNLAVQWLPQNLVQLRLTPLLDTPVTARRFVYDTVN